MKEYVGELKERGLVQETPKEDHVLFEITQEGYLFLQKFQQLKAFTDAFGL